MSKGIIEQGTKELVLLNVDSANPKCGKEVVQRFATGKSLEESTEASDGLDEMFLLSGIFNERL